MDFPIAITLFHVFSIALAAAGAAVFTRTLGLKLFGINTPLMRWRNYSVDPVDVAMAVTVAGVMGLCFSVGAMFAESVLATSKLPHNNVLMIKAAVLIVLVISTISLQLFVKPKLNVEKPFEENDYATLMACCLAMAVLTTAMVFWLMLQANPQATAELILINSAKSFVMTATTLWLIALVVLTSALLRHVQNSELQPSQAFPQAPTRPNKNYFKPEPTFQI
jgi:hypothetical protein